MEILQPVDEYKIIRASARWEEVVRAMQTLPQGKALPVKCESKGDALSLTSYIYQSYNRGIGPKWKCARRDGTTVYISRANGN